MGYRNQPNSAVLNILFFFVYDHPQNKYLSTSYEVQHCSEFSRFNIQNRLSRYLSIIIIIIHHQSSEPERLDVDVDVKREQLPGPEWNDQRTMKRRNLDYEIHENDEHLGLFVPQPS